MPRCDVIETSISAVRGPDDSITYTYQADLEQNIRNPIIAMQMAQTIGPDPLPRKRNRFAGTDLWCNSITGKRDLKQRNLWIYEVVFGSLPQGEDERHQNENPLLRPPVYGVRYIEKEYVIEQAINGEDLGPVFEAGAPYRPAGTLGPIVNAASRRPDEPCMDVERSGVITIERNFSRLGLIMALNENFNRTTNSDTIEIEGHSFVARRLKYAGTTQGGQERENGVTYVSGVTEVEIHRSTDMKRDNVGYESYDAQGELVRHKDKDGNDTAEPDNLTLEGRKAEDGEPTQITWRHLTAVAYAELFS